MRKYPPLKLEPKDPLLAPCEDTPRVELLENGHRVTMKKEQKANRWPELSEQSRLLTKYIRE